MKVIDIADLRGLGIKLTIVHLARLEREGKFPKSFQLSPGGRRHWDADDITAWLEQRKQTPRINTRAAPPPPRKATKPAPRRRLRVEG